MQVDIQNLIGDVLKLPKDAVMYEMSRRLTEAFPGMALWETEEAWAFDISRFAHAGLCQCVASGDVHSEYQIHYDQEDRRATRREYNAWSIATWKGQQFQIVEIGLKGVH